MEIIKNDKLTKLINFINETNDFDIMESDEIDNFCSFIDRENHKKYCLLWNFDSPFFDLFFDDDFKKEWANILNSDFCETPLLTSNGIGWIIFTDDLAALTRLKLCTDHKIKAIKL